MTDTSATWNDERVEQLKKLWAEGKSASQIAAEIGGISRNAVIGKVHRLGLAGRPKAGAAAGAAASGANPGGRGRSGNGEAKPAGAKGASGSGAGVAPRMQADAAGQSQSHAHTQTDARAERNARMPGGGMASDTARTNAASDAGLDRISGAEEVAPSRQGDAARRAGNVAAIPETEERVTIMELREGMCRWPIGDPTSPEFRFCGARSDIGSPYCDHHARIAYQPAADRRRERKAATG